jgi:hypothetical protein
MLKMQMRVTLASLLSTKANLRPMVLSRLHAVTKYVLLLIAYWILHALNSVLLVSGMTQSTGKHTFHK